MAEQENPAAPGIGERDDLVAQLRGRAKYLRDGGEIKSPDLMESAAHEIERLTGKRLVKINQDGSVSLVRCENCESQSAEIARKDARIEELTAADRQNSELLEAAVEGQTYWQTRCEGLEAALRKADGLLNRAENHFDPSRSLLGSDIRSFRQALSMLTEEARDAG